MSDRKRVLTLNFSAGVPFPHTPPTLGWGRGDPASGGGQSCRDESPSKEERGKETEMRRDTKRDSHWRDREKNTTHTHTHTHTRTHHVGGIHKLTRERKSCTSIILKQPPLKSTCLTHTHTHTHTHTSLSFSYIDILRHTHLHKHNVTPSLAESPRHMLKI